MQLSSIQFVYSSICTPCYHNLLCRLYRQKYLPMNNPFTRPANFFECLLQEAQRNEPRCGLESHNTSGASRFSSATIKQNVSLRYTIESGRESHDEPFMTMTIDEPSSMKRVLIWEKNCWTFENDSFSNVQLAQWMIKQVTKIPNP